MAGRKGGYVPATIVKIAGKKATQSIASIALVNTNQLKSGKARMERDAVDRAQKECFSVPITGAKGFRLLSYGPFYVEGPEGSRKVVTGVKMGISATDLVFGDVNDDDDDVYLLVNGKAIPVK